MYNKSRYVLFCLVSILIGVAALRAQFETTGDSFDETLKKTTGQAAETDETKVQAEFRDKYRKLVETLMRVNLNSHSAADAGYWVNARSFVFGEKPPTERSAEAAVVMATQDLTPAHTRAGVNPSLPYYKADTEAGAAMEKRLRETLARLNSQPSVSPKEIADLMEEVAPFLRTVEGAAQNEHVGVVVPPHSKLTFRSQLFCLQHDAPAPQSGPMLVYPSRILIPDEAQEIYAGLTRYSSNNPNDTNIVQTLLWGIRHASESQPLTKLSADQKRVLDAAVANGAEKFINFVEIAQHPEKKPKRGNEAAEGTLLSLDSLKIELVKHHLAVVEPVKHGGANPYNPNDVATIMSQLNANQDESSIIFEKQPTDQVVAAGGSAVFEAKVTGRDLSYQWQFNEHDIADATETKWKIERASKANEGTYQLLVSSHGQTVKSDSAKLKIEGGGRGVGGRSVAPSGTLETDDDPFHQSTDEDPFHRDNVPSVEPRHSPRPAPTEVASSRRAPSTPSTKSGPTLLDEHVAIGVEKKGGELTGDIVNAGERDYRFIPGDWIASASRPSQPTPIILPCGQRHPATQRDSEAAQQILNSIGTDLAGLAPKAGPLGLSLPDNPFVKDFASSFLQGLCRSVPFLGTGISVYELCSRRNIFTGDKLSKTDMVLDGLGLVPVFGGALRELGLGTKGIAAVAKALSGDVELLNAVAQTPTRTVTKAGWEGIVANVERIEKGAEWLTPRIEAYDWFCTVVEGNYQEAFEKGSEKAGNLSGEKLKDAFIKSLKRAHR